MRAGTLQESRWVGRVLREKWRIDRKIARGGMGTVFAATHKNNGMKAAIKVLHPEFARDPDTQSRFLQEGYAANQVGHNGVVRILDDDTTEEGLAYLVMELLEGELLEQRRIANGGRLPVDEVFEVGDQLLDVMVAAHAKGIVHRDIKPDNIFVLADGNLKVLDFGFARMKDGTRTENTATGFLLGTPGFMSPEQAAGNRDAIDARTDIWAIGATLFILLTGQPVHDGETATEMLVQAGNFPVRPIGELDPNLPMKLRQVVDRALAFDRNDRFDDTKSMLNALRAARGKRAPAPSPAADDDGRTLMRGPPSSEDGRTLMRPSPVSMPAALPSSQDDGRTVMRKAPIPAAGMPAPPDDGRTVMRKAPLPAAGMPAISPHDERTVMGRVEELPTEALQSLYTPMTPLKKEAVLSKLPQLAPKGPVRTQTQQLVAVRPSVHPADQEASTLAFDIDGPTMAPTTQKVDRFEMPAPIDVSDTDELPVERFMEESEADEADHTVMMQSRPLPQPAQQTGPQFPHKRPSYPDPPFPIQTPQIQTAPMPQHPPSSPHTVPLAQPMQPRAPHPQLAAPMQPLGPSSIASGVPAVPAAPPSPSRAEGSGGSSVFVFIAVTGITMVIVILTGLIIILGTE